MFLSHNSALIPTVLDMVDAQSQDPYCYNIYVINGSVSTWIVDEVGILCKKV